MSSESQRTVVSITELSGIGPARAKHSSAETVLGLAEMDAQKVYNELAQTGISPDQVESIVAKARERVGIDTEPTVYTEGPSDEGPGAENNRGIAVPDEAMSTTDENETAEAQPESTDPQTTDVEGFITSGDDEDEIDGHGNVLFVGGDGVFRKGAHSDLSPKEQGQLVAKRLVEFDVDLEDVEAMSSMASGAGKPAVDEFVRQTDVDRLPDLVQPFSPSFDAFDSARNAYEDCRERALEWADTLVVFANGDYVGQWIMQALDMNVTVESPEYEADDE